MHTTARSPGTATEQPKTLNQQTSDASFETDELALVADAALRRIDAQRPRGWLVAYGLRALVAVEGIAIVAAIGGSWAEARWAEDAVSLCIFLPVFALAISAAADVSDRKLARSRQLAKP